MPIPWDVTLAKWFDERFAPPELQRSYARPSRRQSATPEIARPSIAKLSVERHPISSVPWPAILSYE